MAITINTKMSNNENRNNKHKLSMILDKNNGREWIDINSSLPDLNNPVVIRITNENIIFAEDDENIIFAEDEKVAKRISDINNPDKFRWSIIPPWPKYDYSPLSSKDQLIDGTVVTHWSYLQSGELDGWNSRLDLLGDYNHLSIKVSADYEEIVYRSLLYGANMIARSVDGKLDETSNELYAAMYAVLTDLQYCIDKDVHISNSKVINNNTPGIDNIKMAISIYYDLANRIGDEKELSKIISALSIIDDNPDKYYKMLEDNIGGDV